MAASDDLPRSLDGHDSRAPRSTFACEVSRTADRVVVGVHGDVDLETAPVLQRDVIAGLEPAVRSVAIDLGRCTFMDSSGLNALLRIHDLARELDIDFALVSVPRTVRRVLDLTDLAEEFGLDGDGAAR